MEIDFAVLGIVLGFSGSSEAYLGPSWTFRRSFKGGGGRGGAFRSPAGSGWAYSGRAMLSYAGNIGPLYSL